MNERRKAPVKSALSRKLGSIMNSFQLGCGLLNSPEEYMAIQHNMGPVWLRHHKSINRNGKRFNFCLGTSLAGSSSRLAFVGTNSWTAKVRVIRGGFYNSMDEIAHQRSWFITQSNPRRKSTFFGRIPCVPWNFPQNLPREKPVRFLMKSRIAWMSTWSSQWHHTHNNALTGKFLFKLNREDFD